MSKFTREELEVLTVKALRRMCVDDLGIVGVTKKPKGVIIDAILANQGGVKSAKAEPVKAAPLGPIKDMNFMGKSQFMSNSAKPGNKYTTTIYMACGVNNGNFSVVGRTVEDAIATFGEILNADIKSTPIVNGEAASLSYVLKEGDVVELLKPAGRKG